MTYLEKVVKGLEQFITDFKPFCGNKADWQKIYDAIVLLKAQEARVIKNSAGNGICPGCGHIIPAWSSPNFCGYCGQAVKWK